MTTNFCLLISASVAVLWSFQGFSHQAYCKEWTDEELRKLEKQWAEQDGEEVNVHLYLPFKLDL